MLQSYLGITVHYFNVKPRKRTNHSKIACREFPNPHTVRRIGDLLLIVIEEYGVKDKIDYDDTNVADDTTALKVMLYRKIDFDGVEVAEDQANRNSRDDDEVEEENDQREADEYELEEEEQTKYFKTKRIKQGK